MLTDSLELDKHEESYSFDSNLSDKVSSVKEDSKIFTIFFQDSLLRRLYMALETFDPKIFLMLFKLSFMSLKLDLVTYWESWSIKCPKSSFSVWMPPLWIHEPILFQFEDMF